MNKHLVALGRKKHIFDRKNQTQEGAVICCNQLRVETNRGKRARRHIMEDSQSFICPKHWKPKFCCVTLFNEKRLSPGNPLKLFVQSFSNCFVISFNIRMVTEACKVKNLALGLFVFVWTWHSVMILGFQPAFSILTISVCSLFQLI